MMKTTANYTLSLCAMPLPLLIGLIVACVVVVGAFLYGVFKRLSRMSWAGLQIPIIFAFTLLLGLFPETMDPTLRFALSAGGFLLFTALVLFSGGLIRRKLRVREDTSPEKIKTASRVFDRLFGGIVAIIDWALLIAVLGLFGLAIAYAAGAGNALGVIYESGIWTKFGAKYAYDLIFISFLVLMIKGAYKLGFVKGLWLVFALALTAVAAFGAVYLSFRVPFLASLAHKIGGTMKLNGITANLIGYLVTAFLCFVVFFIVIVLLFVLINFLVKKMNRSRVFNVIDGCLSALLVYAALVILSLGIGAGVHWMGAGAESLGDVGETISKIASVFENILTGSPFRAVFYECNPFLKLFG